MAEYIIHYGDQYDRFTFLGDVRKRRKELEEKDIKLLIKRHFTCGFRPVYETGKYDKIFEKKGRV